MKLIISHVSIVKISHYALSSPSKFFVAHLVFSIQEVLSNLDKRTLIKPSVLGQIRRLFSPTWRTTASSRNAQLGSRL
jgi:hypothetical protein